MDGYVLVNLSPSITVLNKFLSFVDELYIVIPNDIFFVQLQKLKYNHEDRLKNVENNKFLPKPFN